MIMLCYTMGNKECSWMVVSPRRLQPSLVEHTNWDVQPLGPLREVRSTLVNFRETACVGFLSPMLFRVSQSSHCSEKIRVGQH